MAHPTDGPYIYAAFDDAGELGPSGLDAGTPYGGCKVDTTSRKIPEYDVSMSKVVDQAECTTYCTDNSLGACTYFGRTSADAIPAKAAHTGAVCGGYEADSCVTKYHKFTGKPIWATTTVNLRSMQPTAEGLVGLGPSRFGRGNFGRVPFTNAYDKTSLFDTLVDKDTGIGVYVQGLFGPTTHAHLYASAADADGNVFAVIRPSPAGAMYSNWLNLRFPAEAMEGPSGYQMLVLKINTGPGEPDHRIQPSCLATCTGNLDSIVVQPGHCWIDSQCYAEGETNRPGGHSCQVCDPWKSQTEWSMASTVGQSECFIPTRTRFCHPAGSVITDPRGSSPKPHKTLADCMICDPTESGTAWTTIPSYEPVDLSDPEPVCTLKAAYQPLPPSLPSPSLPSPSPPPSPRAPTEANVESDESDGLKDGAVAGIAVGVFFVGGLLGFLLGALVFNNKKNAPTEKGIDLSGVQVKGHA